MTTFSQRQFLLCCFTAGSVFLSACAMEPTTTRAVPIEDMHAPAHHQHSAPATAQTADTAAANTDATPQPSAPPQPIKNPAAANLLSEAAQARAQGEYARAQTLAERAQTLAPQEARAYLELSRIYAQRGDTAHARQMAIRGLSVVRDDPTTEYDLQQLSSP